MRKFNNLEKQFLRQIVSSKMYLEQGVLRPSVFLDEHYVGPQHSLSMLFHLDGQRILISYPKRNANETRPLLIVVTFFYLLNFLEKDGLIYWLESSPEKPSGVAQGEQYTDGHNILITGEFTQVIRSYFLNIFVPTQDLVDLVKNNFITDEELRHRRNFRISVIALSVSILLGLWGVLRDLFL
jgi:hypothetical protein